MYSNLGVQRYRETDITSMSSEKMIVLLYERVDRDLRSAKKAIEENNRIEMTKQINHSQRIISELRGALDHTIGGEISQNLDALYTYMFHEHLEVLLDRDSRHIDNCLNVLRPLLDAWRQIPTGTGERAAIDQARGLNGGPGGANPATSQGDMNLMENTLAALDYTLRLEAAVHLDNLDLCVEILEFRSQAMAAFEKSHRKASVQERAACRDDIEALILADRKLQADTAAGLSVIAKEFREKMASNQPHHGQSYMRGPVQACIDRMA